MKKFAAKIFIYIFLSTALVIGGMAAITHFWIVRHHMERSLAHSKEMVRLLALKSEDYILRNDLVELHKFFQSILKVDPYAVYIFVERQGEVLVHSLEKGVPKGLLNLGEMMDPSGIDSISVQNNQKEILYHLRIRIGTPPHSILHMGISKQKILSELESHRNIMLLAGLMLLVIVPFCLAFFLSRFVSTPLGVLRNGVRQIGKGDLGCRLELSTGDEIEQLVHDINTMAENLESLRDGLKGEISERLQAQERLAKQSELLNIVLQNVPHHIFWKNRQSVYIGCNRAFAETAGLEDPEDVRGMTDHDLPWDKEKADLFSRYDKKVMDTALPARDVEAVITDANGREKNIIMSLAPLKGQDGQVFGILGICYDITEHKRMQETIKQSQKMEAIGTLAGGIAHDFNNILASIIGYTELAQDDAGDNRSALENLQMVLTSANRAKDLVRQILTFSRKSHDASGPVLFSAVVKEEAKMLRSTLPATIDVRLTVEDEQGMVTADPTQLYQIVINLCANAAHAMKKGGVLEISLSKTSVSDHEAKNRYHGISPGPFMKLKVSDTGTGIDPKIIYRIFEPFFTTKETGVGTGLGLSVVHGIVKDLDGDIQAESRIGQGTTFTVLLPRTTYPVVDEPEQLAEVPKGKGRVLFVDDEKALLELGAKVLKNLGYKVTALNGSLEAFDVYRKSPQSFDIVITDHTMPHLTGYDLSQRILAVNPGARIILCTGYSDSITPEKVLAAGIKAFLYKPYSKNEFAGTIRRVLDA